MGDVTQIEELEKGSSHSENDSKHEDENSTSELNKEDDKDNQSNIDETDDKRKLKSDIFYIEVVDDDKSKSSNEGHSTPAPTPRRINKLRDHSSNIFPAGCMGCREDPPSDQITSPRRFLDPIEAKDYIGHIDSTPRKRPLSAKPRNPLTGVGVDDSQVRKAFGRRKDGNPLLGEGYDMKDITPSCTRIPPGGYSQGLW